VKLVELLCVLSPLGCFVVYSNTAEKVRMEEARTHNLAFSRLVPFLHNPVYAPAPKHFCLFINISKRFRRLY
jgi:hypothetical protein